MHFFKFNPFIRFSIKRIKQKLPDILKQSLGALQDPIKVLAAFVVGGVFLTGGLFVLADSSQPDLAVDSLIVEAQDDDSILVSIDVMNKGMEVSPPSILEITDNKIMGGSILTSISIPSLSPGASHVLTKTYDPEDGVSRISVFANPNNTFKEKTYGNNEKHKHFPFPNLAIRSTSVEIMPNKDYRLTVEIFNDGNSTSPSGAVELKMIKADGSIQESHFPITALGAGEDTSIQLAILKSDNASEVSVFVNKQRTFKELTYGDNQANIHIMMTLPDLAFTETSVMEDKSLFFSIVNNGDLFSKSGEYTVYCDQTSFIGTFPLLVPGGIYTQSVNDCSDVTIVIDESNQIKEFDETNNTYRYVFLPTPLLDLAFTDIAVSEDDTLLFSITNNGNFISASGEYAVYCDQTSYTVTIPALIPGDAYSQSVDSCSDVTIVLDESNQIKEFDETNNTYRYTF